MPPEANSEKTEQTVKNDQHYTCWVLFAVSGATRNPDMISMMLKMDPDRAMHGVGDREGVWQLNSTRGAEESLESHIQELLERLQPVRHEIRRIVRDARVEFYCAVEKDPGAVGEFVLPPRLMLMIGYLGATLVWDVSEKGADENGEGESWSEPEKADVDSGPAPDYELMPSPFEEK